MKLMQTSLIALLLALPTFAPAQDSGAAGNPGCARENAEPELADIIKSYSKRTGKKFIVDPRVRAMGGLVGIDPNKITYEQLLALASVQMFVMVPQGELTIVTVDANARQQPTPVFTDMRFKALDDEWVTLLLSAKNVCAAQLVPILRPLMPQAAHMAANAQTNQLLVTDRAVSVRRVAVLFEQMDAAAPAGQKCAAAPPPRRPTDRRVVRSPAGRRQQVQAGVVAGTDH
jgi:general secretion pathway protein D